MIGNEAKNEVFAKLDELNVGKARVEFSGGGDEGGVDAITFAQRGALSNVINIDIWSKNNWPEGVTNNLVETLSSPVYDRYHTFAGDFWVYGVVIWDAIARKVFFEGKEQEYVDFEEEV